MSRSISSTSATSEGGPTVSHRWFAPAKVNLTLRVLGKRDDGFHALESLMAPLDFCDVLTFERAEAYSLHCSEPGVPVDDTNLVSMAVRLFQRQTGKPCCWRISLEKNIPHGAGLGGGSSDAATTLIALNALEDAGLSTSELSEMAASLGSDVPFFIYRQCCFISGRGEIVTPVDLKNYPGLEGTSLLLIKPSFGVATPDAYKNCLSAKPLPGVDYAPQMMPWGEIVNDLEMPVFKKHLFLAEMKVWLLKQPEVVSAMMSGSGSTMMAFLKNGNQSEDDVNLLKKSSEALLQRARKHLDPTLWGQLVCLRGGETDLL